MIIHRVNEEKNILRTIRKSKTDWIGHILRRNCLRKHVIEGKVEGKIEVTGRRGRRYRQVQIPRIKMMMMMMMIIIIIIIIFHVEEMGKDE